MTVTLFLKNYTGKVYNKFVEAYFWYLEGEIHRLDGPAGKFDAGYKEFKMYLDRLESKEEK